MSIQLMKAHHDKICRPGQWVLISEFTIMVKRYPINAPLKKLGFLPKFDLETITAENKVLQGIYSFVACASNEEIEKISRQIREIRNKSCRAEVCQMMIEEMGFDCSIISGRVKYPQELGLETQDSKWLLVRSKSNFFFDPNYTWKIIQEAEKLQTRADRNRLHHSLMNLPLDVLKFTHWSLNSSWTQLLMEKGYDPISLSTFEESRSLSFNSIHHQVIPMGLVRSFLRIVEPGKVELPVKCLKNSAVKGTFSSDLPLTKLPKASFNKSTSSFELDVFNEGSAVFIVYVGETQNGRCFEVGGLFSLLK